jgi:hypothetical protein
VFKSMGKPACEYPHILNRLLESFLPGTFDGNRLNGNNPKFIPQIPSNSRVIMTSSLSVLTYVHYSFHSDQSGLGESYDESDEPRDGR